MANSFPMLLALMTLLMQYAVIQGQTFENGTEDMTTPIVKEGLLRRLATQWKMGAPIKLSEERKKDLTITEYNKLIREVVEDSDGSHVIDIGDYKPAQKLSSDRHDYIGENGDFRDKPTSGLPGEMKLIPINVNSRLKQFPNRRKRAAVEKKYQGFVEWPNFVIPYSTTNMWAGDDFLTWIDQGVELFHEETCIQWINRTDETEYVDFLGGDRGGVCSSPIGRRTGQPTTIKLDQVTGSCYADFVVYHEMLHAIGFEHEQSRPDRYNVIKTNWECIYPATIGNYLKKPLDTGVEYDETSIMQYPPTIFNTCTGKGTMETTNPLNDGLLYVLVSTLTHYDSQSIVEAYGCNDGCTDNCENGGFIRKTINNDQCHCRCPEYLTGPTCASRTTTCGDIIELQEGEMKQFNTSGFPGPYPVGEACTYLIKAPPNNRIHITVKRLDIPCGHYLEFRTNLISQLGLLLCGSLSAEREFVTPPNSEANVAMVLLTTEDDTLSPGTGASLEVRAFVSGCIDNPCRNGGTCDEDISTPAFCICPPGYSGDTCNFVSATATVGCDLLTDVEGVCCFQDVSTSFLQFFQDRLQDNAIFTYLRPFAIKQYYLADEAVLESNVQFEEAVRCLSFQEAVIRPEGSIARMTTSYIEKDGTVTLVSNTLDTQQWFVLSQVTLPRNVATIRFSSQYYGGESALADITISPGPCSNDTCASLLFEFCDNGGTCMDATGSLSCACPDGYVGPYCEIPLNESIKCTFETGTTCPFVNPPSSSDLWTTNTGPTPQKSTGPSGAYAGDFYLRTDARRNKLTTSTLQLETELSERARCLVLNYNMNGKHIESLAVNQDDSTLFEETGNKKNKWLTKTIDVTTAPQSNLTIVGKARNKKGDIAIDDLELLPFACNKLLICTFEINYQPCTNSRKAKWKRQKGKTKPRTTGPNSAHDGDYYLYLVSNSQESALLTIPHTFSGAACVSFFYHMYGSNTGNLTLYTVDNKVRQDIWTLSGNQGNQWYQTSVNIPVIDGLKVRIEATRVSADGLGDIAIDTVVMKNIACS